jgi:hypothetical protein
MWSMLLRRAAPFVAWRWLRTKIDHTRPTRCHAVFLPFAISRKVKGQGRELSA